MCHWEWIGLPLTEVVETVVVLEGALRLAARRRLEGI